LLKNMFKHRYIFLAKIYFNILPTSKTVFKK